MADGVFERGLNDEFLGALETLANESGSWWSDVLADKGLLIAIRNGYLNIYWRGQSLFNVRMKGSQVVASTHPKYLIDPSLSKLVQFDGREFEVAKLIESGFVRTYEGPDTLRKLKRAANVYAGVEKIGVHAIATADPSIVDVEIAMSTSGMDPASMKEGDAGQIPRIDLASMQSGVEGPELVFWEAKHFSNAELRAEGEMTPQVIGQIAKYETTLAHHRDAVVASYTRVAHDLQRIADMSRGVRTVAPVISAVASRAARLRVRNDHAVGLVVFGFSAADKTDPSWKAHRGKLEAGLAGRFEAAGDPKNIRL